jgi:hypothetical protein
MLCTLSLLALSLVILLGSFGVLDELLVVGKLLWLR